MFDSMHLRSSLSHPMHKQSSTRHTQRGFTSNRSTSSSFINSKFIITSSLTSAPRNSRACSWRSTIHTLLAHSALLLLSIFALFSAEAAQ
jgi:hypothetical protein